jgi:hypothetical protein
MATNFATSDGLLTKKSGPIAKGEAGLRTVQTQMSDKQLAEKGLIVVKQAPTSRLLQKIVGFGQEWDSSHPIVIPIQDYPEFVNDRAKPIAAKPLWLPQFEARLCGLNQAAIEDEIAPSPQSRAEAEAFVKALQGTRMPGVALVGNGNYRLRWKNKAEEVIGLQFRGNGEVQYLFFKRVNDRMEHMLGTKLVSTIEVFITACEMRHVIAA